MSLATHTAYWTWDGKPEQLNLYFGERYGVDWQYLDAGPGSHETAAVLPGDIIIKPGMSFATRMTTTKAAPA